MNLTALLDRQPVVPFGPDSRIPWGEPEFSRRMLRQHLSQDHDRGSRRLEVIDQQVQWLEQTLLPRPPARVLDLGCGPGLHTQRLAAAGHVCIGLDVSPAAIEYAKAEAARHGLPCEYRLCDLRGADLGADFDAIVMWFGEFNTFSPDEAAQLLGGARAALAPGGRILLEVQEEGYVRALGEQEPSWLAQTSGLFADTPHLTLFESEWHDAQWATTERYFVLREGQGFTTYTQTTQAYDDDDLEELFAAAGLVEADRYSSLCGESDDESDLFGVVLAAAE